MAGPFSRAGVEWLVVPVDHADTPHIAVGPNDVVAFATHHSGATFKSDMFVSLLAPDGSTLWEQRAIGRFVRGVAITDEFVYLATEFSGRVVIDELTVRGQDIHGFIGALKLDSGRLVWGEGFGTPGVDRVNDVTTTPDGGVAVAHGFFDKGQIGSRELRPAGGEDAAVTKWSAEGHAAWTSAFAYSKTDDAQGVRAAHDGALFVFGTRYSTKSTWAHEKDAGAHHAWVAKFDAAGVIVWLTEVGAERGQTVVRDVVPYGAGAVVTGSAHGVRQLGGHALSDGHFVAGISSDGKVQWVRSFERVVDISAVDASRSIICTENALLAVSGALPDALDNPTRLLSWDSKKIPWLSECEVAPAQSGANERIVYMAAQAMADATFGGKRLPDPRVRLGPRLPTPYRTFVASVLVE